MRACDDNGAELNAEFSVAADGPYLSVVLESAGGKVTGSARPRNDQYARALTVLLRRLGDRRAVLVSALVASARMSAVPENERTLLHGTVELGSVTDFERLRLDITRAQGRVGLPADAAKEGNNRKRLQLRLNVPGYSAGDAEKLAADLAAAPPSQNPRSWPPARELLRSLIGEEIQTVTGHPNMVLSVHDDMALISTNRSSDRQPIPVNEVQEGVDRLEANGSVRVNVEELGHRSAFVGAVLATLPGARFLVNPATVTTGPPDGAPEGSDPTFGVLDSLERRSSSGQAASS
jgi:hypothetical protein